MKPNRIHLINLLTLFVLGGWQLAPSLGAPEREPISRMRALVNSGGFTAEIRRTFESVSPRLQSYAPDLHDAMSGYLQEIHLSLHMRCAWYYPVINRNQLSQ